MSQGIKIVIHEGNVRILTFNVKRFGSFDPFDLSAATQIQLEITGPDATTNFAPILASSGAAGADWPNGIVVVTVGKAVTDTIGTYEFSLSAFINGEEITLECGTIEIRDRPGYPAP